MAATASALAETLNLGKKAHLYTFYLSNSGQGNGGNVKSRE